MPAAIFSSFNDDLQRVFAHRSPIFWHRTGGPAGGHPLVGWFDQTPDAVDADGVSIIAGHPVATLFIKDILEIDPARGDRDPNEIFKIDKSDTLVVDGVIHRVESCKANGYGSVEVQLIPDRR